MNGGKGRGLCLEESLIMNVAPRVCAGDVNKLGRESDFVEVRVAPGKRDEQLALD